MAKGDQRCREVTLDGGGGLKSSLVGLFHVSWGDSRTDDD